MGVFETEWERPELDTVPSLAENAVWRIPACDDRVLRKLLQESYRDFCRRSAAMRTWRRVELEAGNAHYPVFPVLSGKIDCVTQVTTSGHVPLQQGRRWTVIGDPPVLFLSWLADAEAVSDGDFVIVETVEIPHIGEERAPKAFLGRHGDAIIDGALARMFSMGGRPWTDAEQARQHAIAYENAVSGARMSSMRGGPAANACATPAIDLSGMV